MRQSSSFRLLALVVALVGSLSAPALGFTHGLVHAHLAHEHQHADDARRPHHDEHRHESEPRHDATLVAFEGPAGDAHAHEHPTLEALPGTRHLDRLPLTNAEPGALSAMDVTDVAVISVRAPALTDLVLLARPDPGGGAPPRLRAPPTR